ncbi:MAG: hypothetical protein ACJAZ2_000980 [Glaciecola sp.]|jgi:hypothetical protein
MKRVILFSLLLMVSVSVIGGGPWVQPKGKSYFKLSEWWLVFDEHYTSVGLKDPNVTTGIFNTFLYGEYGITNKFTVIVSSALFSRNYMNNLVSGTSGKTIVAGEAVNYLGDTDLGLKYQLSKSGSKTPIALSVVLGLPTGKDASGSMMNLQTGDGELNQIIQFDIGRGFKAFNKRQAYYTLYGGFNNRTKNFSEEIRFGVEFGMEFFNQKLWVITRANGVESLKNGATAETVTSTSIFANNSEYLSYSVEVNQYVSKNIGISAGFASAFRGEIIAASPSFSVGVFLDLSK